MLEHIPQFRLEKQFMNLIEFLRLMVQLEFLVPDLKNLHLPMLKMTKKFSLVKKYIEFMGVGSAFIRKDVISWW